MVDDRGAHYPVRVDPFIQQGAKLVGSDDAGAAQQGWSDALSADGSTVLVGGPSDNNDAGAAWVFTRARGGWTQQGPKLTASGASGAVKQGYSVALSADGNTALIGGPFDAGATGAAWVFTRSDGVWTQQAKLVGTGAKGLAAQGSSVALSADGNTALVGGPGDDGGVGAEWVYTRSGAGRSQLAKLVGSGEAGPYPADQGYSVALSADGSTALAGGIEDDNEAGAVWVFSRAGAMWSQQGPKLVGSDATGTTEQGSSVALSADGNTALIGGPSDAGGPGAAWVYTREGGAWSQQGPKLTASGVTGFVEQGFSVALSADGNTALVGGAYDNNGAGAAWVFTRAGGAWTQQRSKLVGSDAIGTTEQGSSVALSGDGSTALVGGPYDNNSAGAAWVFGPTAPSASITTPADGAQFAASSVPNAFFSCTPAAGVMLRAGVAGCSASIDGGGEVASGTSLNRSTGSHTITVTATDTDSQTTSVSRSYTVVAVPAAVSAPSISGRRRVGRVLTCSPGRWSNPPTAYSYRWNREGTPIIRATKPKYRIVSLDEGSKLTCTVTASNQAGTSPPSTSPAFAIPVPSVRGCPRATGRVSRSGLGPIRLRMTRAEARHSYNRSSIHRFAYKDFFCLTPRGTLVGYASPKLLRALPRRERRRYRGRVVWASTSNPYYAVAGTRTGATLKAAEAALPHGTLLRVGRNHWYLAPHGAATAVLNVQHAVVEEIGIAVATLTRTPRAKRTLITSFS